MKENRLYKLIIFLTVLAIVGVFADNVTQFLTYDYRANGLEFNFPGILDFVITLLEFVPAVLLLLYVGFLHKKNRAPILFPVVCGLLAVIVIVNYVWFAIQMERSWTGYLSAYRRAVPLSNTVVMVIRIVTLALLTWQALRGLPNKTYLIIACSFGIIWPLQSVLSNIGILSHGIAPLVYILLGIGGTVGSMVLYLAILLFALNFKLPAVLKKKESVKEE